MIRLLSGDCREILKTLPDESIHCVVTSPPYWGLRDYGVDGQLGLETSLGEHVETMVCVFREVRRVLRSDGTLWLNYGDSYAAAPNGRSAAEVKALGNDDRTFRDKPFSTIGRVGKSNNKVNIGGDNGFRVFADGYLKPKDLCGIPWRVALALQADGWVLRQEIIWAKPNPMPESVTDRCTKAHESIFLFAKAKWMGPSLGRFAHISDEDARWLALCVDTEGCISVKRVRQLDGGADAFGPQVTFGGTNRALVERFQALAGHGNIGTRPGKNAPMFYWQIGNNIARDFLYRIYPFLIVKQRQARIAIYTDDLVYYRGGKFLARKQRKVSENEQLLSLWARNKQCNQFGNPDLSDVPEPEYGRWADCERYYYDADAIAETANRPEGAGNVTNKGKTAYNGGDQFQRIKVGLTEIGPRETRNKRSVWEIATAPFSEAHFATFPPALIEPCILAGCPEKCCSKCGAPFVRDVIEAGKSRIPRYPQDERLRETKMNGPPSWKTYETVGFSSSCFCSADTVPGVVLDPFGGAGTTGLVADRLGRGAILIELNPEYAAMAERRIKNDAGMFAELIAS